MFWFVFRSVYWVILFLITTRFVVVVVVVVVVLIGCVHYRRYSFFALLYVFASFGYQE